MKLKEVMEKATKGPIRNDHGLLWARSVGGCRQTEEDFMFAMIRGWGHLQYNEGAEETQETNAALLAHWYNVGPKLLKALELIMPEWDRRGPDPCLAPKMCRGCDYEHEGACMSDIMREAISEANEVTL